MFNIKIKNEFLNELKNESTSPERTAVAYGNVFKSSKKIEELFQKDLFNFNLLELNKYFEYRSPKTKASARTVGRIVTKYIDWAIEKGYRKDKCNPLDIPQDYFSQFVKSRENEYLTVEQIQDTVDHLQNYQDAVLIALLFNGVQGKEVSEIRNLTISDINVRENTLSVKDDKTGKYREVDLSRDGLDTITLALRAHAEPDYLKNNGEHIDNPRIKPTVELALPSETEYVIKTGKTQKMHYYGRASQYTIYNRLEMIRSREDFEDYSESLVTKNIVRSGMIHEAKRMLDDEGGELDAEKIERICKKYNVASHWAVKDFLNMETIENMYGRKMIVG